MQPQCGKASQDNINYQKTVNSGQDAEEALKFLASAGDKRESWGHEDWEWDSQAMVASRRNAKGSTIMNRSCHAPTAPALDLLHAQVAPCAGSNPPTSSESDPCSEEEAHNGGAGIRSNRRQKSFKNHDIASRSSGGCQADGCTRDLSQLTYYHVRNK